MLQTLKEWLAGNPETQQEEISVELAACALLVEVMAADDEWAREEEVSIAKLLANTLGLADSQATALIQEAKKHHKDASDLYAITKKINSVYSPEQKFELVENMWKVAFVDGDLDRYEDYMIRKISELLYVPHSEFIRAKLSADPNTQ